MNALIPIVDVEKMALAVAKSGLFGAKTQDQAFALMMIAQAEGMHPAQACMEFDIIQGRPARKSTALLGRFQQAGGVVNWIKHEDKEVSAEFSHPQSPTPLLISWDMERAKRAGLTGKDNWIKYPRQMLRARVIAEGVRACYPSVCSGIMVAEEAEDLEVPKAPVKPVNTVEGLKEALKPVQEAEIVPPTPVKAPVDPVKPPVPATKPVETGKDYLDEADEAIKAFNGEIVKPSLAELAVGDELAQFDGLVNGVNSREKQGKNKDKTITEYSVEASGGESFLIAKWGSPKDGVKGQICTFLCVKRREDFHGVKQFLAQDIILFQD